MLISSFWTVFDRRSVTPLTLKRLPSMRKPTRGVADGTIRLTTRVTTIGKRTISIFLTVLGRSMCMVRSRLVVSAFISGG